MSGTSYTPNELLIDERKKRSWTKAELAEKIGASSDSVAHWERGETFPSPSNLMKLCEIFEKSPDDLGLSQKTFHPSQQVLTGPPLKKPKQPLSRFKATLLL